MTCPDAMPQTTSLEPARHPDQPAKRAPRYVFVLVAVYAAGILLPFLGSGRTLTKHEVLIALPAKEMLASGDWVVPTYNRRTWLAKPPLLYWLTAGAFLVRGECDELAARLPAAGSGIVLCLIITGLAGRWFGATAALLAGLVQASCVYTFMQGRLGEIDMPFACLLAADQAILAIHWGRGTRRLPLRDAIAFHALAGLAVLAKGPMALLLLGATVLGWCVVRRSLRPLRAVLFTPAILCFCLVAVPWPLAVALRTGNEAWTAWYDNYVARFTGAHRLGAQSPLYYLLHVPWLVLPWSVVLLLGCKKLWTACRATTAQDHRFLWTWFVAGFLLLSISAGKHKHYAIPILPPLSILTATLLADGVKRLARRARPVFATAFGIIFVVYIIVGGWIMPARDPRKATAEFVREATAALPPEAALFVAGLGQSAAYFYIARDYTCLDSLSDLPPGAHDAYVLTPAAHADELAAARGLTVTAQEPQRESRSEGDRLVLLQSSPKTSQ